jgi:hypothetical protein
MTKEDILRAVLKYPYPNFVYWNLHKFPSRKYIIAGCVVVAVGFILTAFKVNKIYISVPTYVVALMLVFAACLHVPVWCLKRRTEKRRAKYLGISLNEYIEYYHIFYGTDFKQVKR